VKKIGVTQKKKKSTIQYAREGKGRGRMMGRKAKEGNTVLLFIPVNQLRPSMFF
jgi:hypothetical protein